MVATAKGSPDFDQLEAVDLPGQEHGNLPGDRQDLGSGLGGQSVHGNPPFGRHGLLGYALYCILFGGVAYLLV